MQISQLHPEPECHAESFHPGRVATDRVSGQNGKKQVPGEFESVRAFIEISMLQGEGKCINHNLIKYVIYIYVVQYV